MSFWQLYISEWLEVWFPELCSTWTIENESGLFYIQRGKEWIKISNNTVTTYANIWMITLQLWLITHSRSKQTTADKKRSKLTRDRHTHALGECMKSAQTNNRVHTPVLRQCGAKTHRRTAHLQSKAAACDGWCSENNADSRKHTPSDLRAPRPSPYLCSVRFYSEIKQRWWQIACSGRVFRTVSDRPAGSNRCSFHGQMRGLKVEYVGGIRRSHPTHTGKRINRHSSVVFLHLAQTWGVIVLAPSCKQRQGGECSLPTATARRQRNQDTRWGEVLAAPPLSVGLRNASHVKDISVNAAGIVPDFNEGANERSRGCKGSFVHFQITKIKRMW